MKVAWDIDGTICLNPGPIPDWSKPGALAHTGESVNSYMPKFRALNYLNPEMEQVNREMIEYIITGRPANTIDPTITELQRYGVQVCRDNVHMFPNPREWSARLNRISKEVWLRDGKFTHYVDNDPFLCVELRRALEKSGSDCWCGSISEFLELGLQGWAAGDTSIKTLTARNASNHDLVLRVKGRPEEHFLKSRRATKIQVPKKCALTFGRADGQKLIAATINLRPETTEIRMEYTNEILSVYRP